MYFLGHYHTITPAKQLLAPDKASFGQRLQRVLQSKSLREGIATLRGTADEETLQAKSREYANSGLRKLLSKDFAIFQRELAQYLHR